MDDLVTTIPSSFVVRANKLGTDRGSGESKLYIGPMTNVEQLDEFFLGWHPLHVFELVPENLLLYLESAEAEFSKQSHYKAVTQRLRNRLISEVERRRDFRIALTPFKDKRRYYIRGSTNPRTSSWNLLRQISLPLVTDLIIERGAPFPDGSADFALFLHHRKEPRKRSPLSGIQHDSITPPALGINQFRPALSRHIPQSVKDMVWQRDRGMCQANWRIDPSFDKFTGETCGSNLNLEFDHIVPYSKGGRSTYRNLQLLCERHNRMKSDKEV